MSAAVDLKRRIRSSALLWMAVALAVYVAYIVMAIYRSRH